MQQPAVPRPRRAQAFAATTVWFVLGTGGAFSVGGCAASCSSLQLTAQRFFSAGGHPVDEPDPMLEALVTDSSGHPVAHVSVEFFIESDDIGSATTGADGVARHQAEITQTVSGDLSRWSAQISDASCRTTNTAEYTSLP